MLFHAKCYFALSLKMNTCLFLYIHTYVYIHLYTKYDSINTDSIVWVLKLTFKLNVEYIKDYWEGLLMSFHIDYCHILELYETRLRCVSSYTDRRTQFCFDCKAVVYIAYFRSTYHYLKLALKS